MILKIFYIVFITTSLFATTVLKQNYYIPTHDVMLSDIVSKPVKDVKLLSIVQGRYTKRVRTSDLVALLERYGYSNMQSSHSYTKFIQQPTLELTPFKNYIKKRYKEYYKDLEIKNITVHPRGHITKLPQNYTLFFKEKALLKNKGIFSIKTDEKKQIFFNYTINASLPIFITKQKIKKKKLLSLENTSKKSIILQRFQAKPLQEIRKDKFETKRYIRKGKILTVRDVEALKLVTKGSNVHLFLNVNNINISFTAKALEDGELGKVIKVKNRNNKILQVEVIGKNKGRVL